jgi:hypothetical protein
MVSGGAVSVMRHLLDWKGDEVQITEDVVTAAAGNEWNGAEVVRPSKAEREIMRLLTIEDYLAHLKNMNKIDAHRYDVPVDLEGEYRIPKKLNAADTIEPLCSKKTGPVNFLNLEGWRPNPEPPFLDNLWPYRLFRAVRKDGISGKMI